MRRRNWTLILPAAALAGFAPFALAGSAAFGVLAAFLAPIALLMVFAWRDWQERQAAEEFENARLAAFVKERAATPPAPAAAPPSAPPAVASPAAATGPSTAISAKPAAPAPKPAPTAPTPAPAARPMSPPANTVAGTPGGGEHAAARVILEALAANDAARATAVFRELGARRGALPLSPTDWGRVGAAALEQGAFLDAAWALHAGALLAGDAAAAQKHLVAVAGKASAAGDARVALKLYGNLLKKYPASPYADFVRSSMRAEQKKAGKA